MANTNASGDRMITHLRMPGAIMIDAAMPEPANSIATMPVSSTPDAM